MTVFLQLVAMSQSTDLRKSTFPQCLQPFCMVVVVVTLFCASCQIIKVQTQSIKRLCLWISWQDVIISFIGSQLLIFSQSPAVKETYYQACSWHFLLRCCPLKTADKLMKAKTTKWTFVWVSFLAQLHVFPLNCVIQFSKGNPYEHS